MVGAIYAEKNLTIKRRKGEGSLIRKINLGKSHSTLKTVYEIIHIIFLACLIICSIDAKDIKYIKLKAIPCRGSYSVGGIYSDYLRTMRMKKSFEFENGYLKSNRQELPSFYFAPERISTETVLGNDNIVIMRNMVPVPIKSVREDIECSILSAMDDQVASNIGTWSGAVLTDRDRGIYDNLSFLLSKWLKLPDKKKQIFENLRLKGNSLSPYHSFVNSLEKNADMKITGLLLEVADSPNDVSLTLGAAVFVSKSEFSKNWILRSKNVRQTIQLQRKTDEFRIINCHVDELFGLHLATKLPVYIAEALYQRVTMDGLLENKDSGLMLTAPYFDRREDSVNWNKQLEQSRARPAKAVPSTTDIKDATTFLTMRTSEKRACLRASGVFNLPRPREGPKMVDAIMIPLLDEEVAYEVLRRLGETRGDFTMASKMSDFETRKPLLARLCNEASKRGDRTQARKYVDEMNSISTLAYDPNNPDEEVKEGFDIEEWYWEQRKRVYGIIAA